MDELQQKIDARIKAYSRCDRRNYLTAFGLLILSVVASAMTAVAVAGNLFPRPVVAILAAAPGIFILVGATFRFEQRAKWYWRKRMRLEKLSRQLRFEGLAPAEVSRRWNEIDDDMFDQWPGFGASFGSKDSPHGG